MRIESSTVQLHGTSTSVEAQTKDETLKTWLGNSRPVFTIDKPTVLFLSPDDSQAGYTLQLSEEGKAALEKQIADANAGTATDAEELSDWISETDWQKMMALEKMLEALSGKKLRFVPVKSLRLDMEQLAKLKENIHSISLNRQQLNPQQAIDLRQGVNIRKPQGWGLEYDLHETHYEKQTMSFSTEGTVKTEDGKEIKFDLDLNMSREVSSRLDVSIRGGDAVRVDPLVINYASASARLTNNKFSFDLDNDGDSEQISFATNGSGYLALDANNDGAINNGSELFGPQSGNGFEDLAKYDGDKNGWIDENDEIYSKLRIWTKDETGKDQLFALGQKGVGAIYLGNVSTAYDVKDSANQTQGSIARTGVFLNENGTAGTIQHVDIVI